MRPLAPLSALSLLVASCFGGAAPEPTTTTSSSSTTTTPPTTTTRPATTTTTEPPPASPLNALPADDPALLDRRVLAVKIDDHWNARPQSGLQEADAVYEVPVEAGLTRFIALFHHADSTYVGPMRSARPTDPTLLKPLGATFAMSGAQGWVLGLVRSQGVPLLGENGGTFRIRGRLAPHNLYADTTALRQRADRHGFPDDPPPDLFSWEEANPERGDPAERISFGWSPGHRVTWEWNGSRYLRFVGGEPHEWIDVDGERGQVEADTLVVIFAPRYTASGGSGSPVPAFHTVGEGRALVFADGSVWEATWSRDSIEETFRLTGEAGATLPVPPGIPWISIFPTHREVSW